MPLATGKPLVLVESLIHVLIERSALTVQDAISAIQTAIEVTTGESIEARGREATPMGSVDRLFRILESLTVDAHPAPSGARNTPYPPLHSVD